MLVLIVEKGDRLELVVAGPAVPKIGGPPRTAFNPLRAIDRLPALRARITLRQTAEI